MFDLDAGVHFEEVEIERFGIDEEFHRPGAAIVQDAFGETAPLHRLVASVLVGWESPAPGASSTSFWKRRWIEQSRVPRWMARFAVTQNLHFDMAAAAR